MEFFGNTASYGSAPKAAPLSAPVRKVKYTIRLINSTPYPLVIKQFDNKNNYSYNKISSEKTIDSYDIFSNSSSIEFEILRRGVHDQTFCNDLIVLLFF